LRVADRELEILRDSLREHINALAVDIGPRTPLDRDSLVRAANYINSVFEESGLSVREEEYPYADQRVTNVLATAPIAAATSGYSLVAAYLAALGAPQGADDNGGAVGVLWELARRIRHNQLKALFLFASFPLEEPPAYLTGHQGSRIFVRNCQTSGDRVL